jgi:hypothetical protein
MNVESGADECGKRGGYCGFICNPRSLELVHIDVDGFHQKRIDTLLSEL